MPVFQMSGFIFKHVLLNKVALVVEALVPALLVGDA